MTTIYLITIPLIAVVNTALIVWMMSLAERIDRIELREEHARFYPSGDGYLWARPSATRSNDHD